MNRRLHHRFAQLEHATAQLLREAEQLGERAYQAPATGQWSGAQVVHHLLAAEAAIGQYLQDKLRKQEQLSQGGLRARFRATLLRVLLRLPGFKFKAPSRVAALTPDDARAVPALPELRRQWAASRRQLEQLLDGYPDALLSRAIFKHPRAGMLTISQTLDFMLDHVLHHRQQLARISKTLNQQPVSQ